MLSGNINGTIFPVYTYGEIVYRHYYPVPPDGYITWEPTSATGTVYYYSNMRLESRSLYGGSVDCNSFYPNQYFTNCTWSRIYVNLPQTEMWLNHGLFEMCSSLREAQLYKCLTIGENAFVSCYNLSRVIAPHTVYIKEAAFINCLSLSSVSLPNCAYIGPYAFALCTSLEQLNLPHLMVLCAFAFASDYSLSKLTFGGSSVVSYVMSGVFTPPLEATGITSSTGSIFVRQSLVSLYKTDSVWSYYSNVIYPM